MTQEIYKRCRPKQLQDVIGQETACKTLERMLAGKKVPHAVLFTGPPGTGKTTCARILARNLLGRPLQANDPDFDEVNCASLDSAIAAVREIQQAMSCSPLNGPCRVWVLDEVQSLSRAGFAQQALLKMLEDTPPHVYFMLCTTDPGKLIKAVLSRCTEVRMKGLADKELRLIVSRAAKREGGDLSDEVLSGLVAAADGSARTALVLLDRVLAHEDEGERLEIVKKGDEAHAAVDVVKVLLDARKKWPDVAKVLRTLEGDAEEARRVALGYAAAVALNATGPRLARCMLVISAMECHFIDSGKAGLYRACYEVLQGG